MYVGLLPILVFNTSGHPPDREFRFLYTRHNGAGFLLRV